MIFGTGDPRTKSTSWKQIKEFSSTRLRGLWRSDGLGAGSSNGPPGNNCGLTQEHPSPQHHPLSPALVPALPRTFGSVSALQALLMPKEPPPNELQLNASRSWGNTLPTANRPLHNAAGCDASHSMSFSDRHVHYSLSVANPNGSPPRNKTLQ